MLKFFISYKVEIVALGAMLLNLVYSIYYKKKAEKLKGEYEVLIDTLKTIYCIRDIKEANLEEILSESNEGTEKNYVVTFLTDPEKPKILSGLDLIKKELSSNVKN